MMLKLKEAAAQLRISPEMLTKERRRGNITHIRIGRLVFFKPEHLEEYERKCTIPSKNLGRLATTGFPRGEEAPNGAGHGTTAKLDRHDAHQLAQRIFKRPRSGCSSGSANTAS